MLGLFKMFVAFLIVDIFYFILHILFSMRFQEYYLLYRVVVTGDSSRKGVILHEKRSRKYTKIFLIFFFLF